MPLYDALKGTPHITLQAGFEVAANAELVELAAEMANAALENVVLAEGPESP